MHLQLLPKNASLPVVHLALDEQPVRLGRSEAADVCISDRWLSRFHCEFEFNEGAVVVRDLKSKHGTYVNGQAIEQSSLRAGDELSVGMCRFQAVSQ